MFCLGGSWVLTPAVFGCGSGETARKPIPGADSGAKADSGTQAGPDAGADAQTACIPTTCSGDACGKQDDGCGQSLDCGPCPQPCQPTSCEAEGANCGEIPNGCGENLDCGRCTAGFACGAELANVCGCADDTLLTRTGDARRAASTGFAGSEKAYTELFGISCEAAELCVNACTERRGTPEFCGASECLLGFDLEKKCLPPTVWDNLGAISVPSDDPFAGVRYIAVAAETRDTLLVDTFRLGLPPHAVVRGIEVKVRRSAGPSVADNSVRLVKAGEVVGADRAAPEAWSADLEWVTYGGADDTWGVDWAAADVNSTDFGVALSVAYGNVAGNSRAYVNQVQIVVHYTGC